MPNFSESKNIVYHSPIYAQGNVHIGDIYNIQGEQREIPLQLNTLPFIAKEAVIGRDTDLEKVKTILQSSDLVVLMNGIGGIGKTTLAKYFTAEFRPDYNYVAWVNNTSNIKEAFTNDIALVDSLHLRNELETLSKNDQWVDQAFSLILNRMRQLGGNNSQQKNLLIIDNAGEDIEHTQTLDQIALRPNWKVLVTSREKLLGFTEYELGFLSLEAAKQLFYLHYHRERDDDLVEEILGIAEYHTLTIELLAKTIQNHLGLNLSKLKSLLTSEGLNISKSVNVKMPNYHENTINTNIIKCLEIAFDLSFFEENSMGLYLLSQFSVLPSKEIHYKELKEVFGVKYGSENSEENLINELNKLAIKGWLSKTNNGYKSHKVILEVVRRKEKPYHLSCLFLILNLTTKLKELNTQQSPETLNYLSYGESILKNIKEPVQPLYLLANNIFEGFRHLGFREKAYLLRLSYLPNAEKVYQSDITKLATSNFATYLGNLALSSKEVFEITKDETFLKKAINFQTRAVKLYETVKEPSEEERFLIANGYDGLTSLFLYVNQNQLAIPIAIKSLDYKMEFLKNDVLSHAISLNILANIYINLKDYQKAKNQLFLAIDILKNTSKGNKKLLAKIYCQVSYVFLLEDNVESAEKFQIEGILEFSNGGFFEDIDWANYLKKITLIFKKKKDFKNSLKFAQNAYESYQRQLGIAHPLTLEMNRIREDISSIAK